jgi:hypothetical protein
LVLLGRKVHLILSGFDDDDVVREGGLKVERET